MFRIQGGKILSIFLCVFLVWVIFCATVFANEELFYKEINLIGGYSGRDHWVGKSHDLANSIGFED
ncbi:MAG: hypothetical protein KJ710_03470, partial [Candidatus Omnitrophica bacterium]|nr:hypothetical protein [Candidatus Omnitrophota bacterium]